MLCNLLLNKAINLNVTNLLLLQLTRQCRILEVGVNVQYMPVLGLNHRAVWHPSMFSSQHQDPLLKSVAMLRARVPLQPPTSPCLAGAACGPDASHHRYPAEDHREELPCGVCTAPGRCPGAGGTQQSRWARNAPAPLCHELHDAW